MTKPDLSNFAAFILTNRRPDNVITYATLRRSGYTGRIVLLVDDLDPTRDQYIERYGQEVVVFDKRAAAAKFDQGDNFDDMRAIIYARNASFDVAESLGIPYFIQLDDDYRHFQFRFNDRLSYRPRVLKDLDRVFAALLRFFVSSGVASLAVAQGGDFIGGEGSPNAQRIRLKRKCMNSFICATERRFQFVGRINEDVNTYTRLASTGLLLLTTNQLTLEQTQTQANAGGMSDLYLDSGTYVKSFYSVMYHPSGVKIGMMNSKFGRLHHKVDWNATAPLILSESLKKSD